MRAAWGYDLGLRGIALAGYAESMDVVRLFLRSLLFAAAIAALPALACATDEAAPDSSVSIGFSGQYKVGAWTPIWLTPDRSAAAVDPGQVVVTVPDGDGVPTHYSGFVSRPGSAGSSSPLLGYARFGRLHDKVQVRWQLDGAATATFDPPPALISTRRLIVSLADDLGVEAAVKLSRGNADTRAVVATVTDPHVLPDRWYGYEGLDVVVVSTAADGAFAKLSAEQHAALETWVRLGGRLIVNLAAAEAPAAQLKEPLARVLPGRWQGLRSLRDASDLERFLGRSTAVEIEPATATDGGLKHVQLDGVQGVVDCPAGAVGREHPLLVRSAHGLGQVTVIAIDLTQPALAEWADRPRLLHALLEGGEPAQEAHEESWGEAAQLGFTEMSGQLRSALDQFPTVRVAPFSTIAALAGLYILCLGPLDYFLLRRLGVGAEFTWLSFALLVLLASGGALATARAWKGESVQVNQVDLVDADLATGTVRGTAWAHVFSPHNETFDLQLKTPAADAGASAAKGEGCLLSWQGLAGTGLGGMDLARYSPPFAEPYTIAAERSSPGHEQTLIEGAPIPVGGTKSFLGRWWQEGSPRVEAKLTATENKLAGEIYNPLPWTIEDPMLFYAGEFYRLGEPLPPQQGRAFDSTLLAGGPRSLKFLLNRRRVLDTKESKDVSSRYDPTSFDVQRIMEISLLHKVAGGANYTVLTQRYQAFVDASDLLAVERAVIMGRVREPATELRRDGEPLVAAPARHATFVRLVLPVISQPANPAPSP